MAQRIRDGKGHRAYRRKRERLKREGRPCAWCGEPIDYALPYQHQMAFTADHPDALNNGGDLVAQDLKPMHRRCNATKKDRAQVEIWGAS